MGIPRYRSLDCPRRHVVMANAQGPCKVGQNGSFIRALEFNGRVKLIDGARLALRTI